MQELNQLLAKLENLQATQRAFPKDSRLWKKAQEDIVNTQKLIRLQEQYLTCTVENSVYEQQTA